MRYFNFYGLDINELHPKKLFNQQKTISLQISNWLFCWKHCLIESRIKHSSTHKIMWQNLDKLVKKLILWHFCSLFVRLPKTLSPLSRICNKNEKLKWKMVLIKSCISYLYRNNSIKAESLTFGSFDVWKC